MFGFLRRLLLSSAWIWLRGWATCPHIGSDISLRLPDPAAQAPLERICRETTSRRQPLIINGLCGATPRKWSQELAQSESTASGSLCLAATPGPLRGPYSATTVSLPCGCENPPCLQGLRAGHDLYPAHRTARRHAAPASSATAARWPAVSPCQCSVLHRPSPFQPPS